MIEKTKTVFYCSHCKKHGLSRRAMEKHELHCTMNPDRRCRWHLLEEAPSARMVASGADTTHRMRRGLPRWVRMFAPLDERRIDRLRIHAHYCPACMLSAIRQCGIDRWLVIDHTAIWDYGEEVERYRKEERENWEYEERRAIEATFL